MRINEFEKVKKEIRKDTISILAYSIPRILSNKPKQDFSYWYTDYFFNVYQLDEHIKLLHTAFLGPRFLFKLSILWINNFIFNFWFYIIFTFKDFDNAQLVISTIFLVYR